VATHELRQMISQSLGQQWETFREHHPMLATVIDQDVATEQCMRDLREDPQLQEALRQVEMAGLAQEVLQGLVVSLVKKWMVGL
jgi:hypothetical protein